MRLIGTCNPRGLSYCLRRRRRRREDDCFKVLYNAVHFRRVPLGPMGRPAMTTTNDDEDMLLISTGNLHLQLKYVLTFYSRQSRSGTSTGVHPDSERQQPQLNCAKYQPDRSRALLLAHPQSTYELTYSRSPVHV